MTTDIIFSFTINFRNKVKTTRQPFAPIRTVVKFRRLHETRDNWNGYLQVTSVVRSARAHSVSLRFIIPERRREAGRVS